ncbi:MAG: PAC2 family protein [Candidatus Parvarchaeota archaeon]|nr:PAC2 family protein [Candidatus Jingweiarchaeum tengchongense]MCW1298325.1 PAC2 family protein [Candidatus Jingweiarchaeum tengchongense]MCW1300416.1 PAC2 family protein [Candidatus Jingweiarchaeum tengchongense]MCW1304738.1 PAC2 family protein [Candidatus Jingweiarchaeum tengchongense]MCW1309722.1 PAC2 family protein [Candidatus Jingweiarchaeum tengchongense]
MTRVRIIADDFKPKNPIVIEGFQGFGLVGVIAAEYLADKFNMRQVGHIESNALPAMALLINGEVKFPIRIFADDKNELVVFDSELPIPQHLAYDIAKEIAEWAEKNNARQIICLEGLAVPTTPQESNVYGIANSKELEEKIKKKVKIIDNGIIIGVSAALLLECQSRNIPAICLMAECHSEFPDGRAAVSVLRALSDLLNLKLDVSPLEKEALEAQKKIKSIIEKAKKIGEVGEKPERIYG